MTVPDNPWSQTEALAPLSSNESVNIAATGGRKQSSRIEYDGFHHKKWITLTQDESALWTAIVNNEMGKDEVQSRKRSRKGGRLTLIELKQKNTNWPSAVRQHDCTNHESSYCNYHYTGQYINGHDNTKSSQKFQGNPSYNGHDGRNQYNTGRNTQHYQKASSSYCTHPSYHQVPLYQKPPPGNDTIEARHKNGIPLHHQVYPPQAMPLAYVLVYHKKSKLPDVKAPDNLETKR